MIPERVTEITSATSRNEKLFETPIGRFSYKSATSSLFFRCWLDVWWKWWWKIYSNTWKALCDKIRYDRGIGTLTQSAMTEYLKYDLRLEITNPFDSHLIEEIATAYRSKNLKHLAQLVHKGKLWPSSTYKMFKIWFDKLNSSYDALREILQEIVLLGLYDAGFLNMSLLWWNGS